VGYELVVIGTSLGGLNAIKVLLSQLPANFPLPIVVVQHRGKDPDEELCQHLQQFSQLRISEADDKEKILAGRVYLAPPNYHLLVEKSGSFALSTEAPVVSARPSIDVLFDSAAVSYGNKVIAIVLTGASKDGAFGVSKIQSRGGLVIVQEPSTAESSVMPKAAIAAITVEYILPLEEIGVTLLRLV
jgi:two-component system, chemotaxis family, protein-glutamate methylesterase/glutaminase